MLLGAGANDAPRFYSSTIVPPTHGFDFTASVAAAHRDEAPSAAAHDSYTMYWADDPQPWREGTSSTLNYPYDLAGLGSITNSTAGPSLDYYYFFYEWNVESTLDVECVSARADVDVVVTQCTDPQALSLIHI